MTEAPRAIRIARESERPISAVARGLGMHPETTLRVWVRQDEADDGTRTDRLTTAEREVLAALAKISSIQALSDETYGTPRIHMELRASRVSA